MLPEVKFKGTILDFLFFLRSYVKRRQMPGLTSFSPQFSVFEPDIESITDGTRFAQFHIEPSSNLLETERLEVVASHLPDKVTLLTAAIKPSELFEKLYGQIQVEKLNLGFDSKSSKLWNDILSELADQGWLPENKLEAYEEYNLQQLRQLLQDRLNLADVRDLCFELGIKFENLGESTLNGTIRELLIRIQQLNRVDDLREACKKLRPDLDL